MVKAGSVVVSMIALMLGLLLGLVGLFVMVEAGSFADASTEAHSGPLGLWGGESQNASVNTPAIVGLLLAIVGASAFLFGLRALFVSVQGQSA